MNGPFSKPTERPTVIYIAGWGRSGSTILDRILGQTDGVASLGELSLLWERGVARNEYCGCGQPFNDCDFWTRVGERAFGRWDAVSPERIRWLRRIVARPYHQLLPRVTRRRREGERELASYLNHVYCAVAEVAEVRTLVDSSKQPVVARILARNSIDIRVLHLIRDPRGVAYSWSKDVLRVDATGGTGDRMQKFSAFASGFRWDVVNVLALRLSSQVPYVAILYEDLVRNPREALRTINACLDLQLPLEGLVGPENEVMLGVNHTVAGNPSRLLTGPTLLKEDAQWRTSLPRRDRRLISLLTAPLRMRFDYR